MRSSVAPVLVSLDYRGRAKFGCDYRHARHLCDALLEVGRPAVLFNINDPLSRTLKRWQGSPFFVLADTFSPGSANAERYPEPFGLRRALEFAGQPYIGSTFAALSRSSSANKIVARQYLKDRVCLPPAEIVKIKGNPRRAAEGLTKRIALPVVVKKPFQTGSSIGVFYVDSKAMLEQVFRQFHLETIDTILAERFVQGREFTVWIMEASGRPFCYGTEEIHKPKDDPIFTHEGKILAQPVTVGRHPRVGDVPRFESPPRLPRLMLARIESAALKAHGALGLRHYSRVDLILRHGVPFVIDVNARPQLRDGGLGYVAAKRGEKFGSALRRLVEGVSSAAHHNVRSADHETVLCS